MHHCTSPKSIIENMQCSRASTATSFVSTGMRLCKYVCMHARNCAAGQGAPDIYMTWNTCAYVNHCLSMSYLSCAHVGAHTHTHTLREHTYYAHTAHVHTAYVLRAYCIQHTYYAHALRAYRIPIMPGHIFVYTCASACARTWTRTDKFMPTKRS